MENKPTRNSLGRFWWLHFLVIILTSQIGIDLAIGSDAIRFILIILLVYLPLGGIDDGTPVEVP